MSYPASDLERGQGQGRSISHPYPPSYRDQLTSPSKSPANHPDPNLYSNSSSHTHSDINSTSRLEYQQRRQERRDEHPSIYPSTRDNPYEDPYAQASHSHPPRNPLDSSDGYRLGRGAGSGSSRPTRLNRSASESSTHPALADGIGHGGIGGIGGMGSSSSGQLSELSGKEGRPTNWTKEDEEAERAFLAKGMINWNELKSWRFWFRKEWWYWYIIIVVAAVLVALMTIFHDDIVKWMQPFANWMKDLPGGWAIPIGIFFVLSFPPLFGQEILAVLVGAVWGLWAGFGITAAGTFLGEVGNFYAFKYCLRSTAEKYERKNINYACMAHVVREGGFWMIFAIRLSAIPGHFSTAVFATCGMGIWIFMIATILTLPKQLIVVYLGVHFNEQEEQTKSEKAVSYAIVAVGFLITIWAAWYIWKQMHKARVHVWRKRRIEAASKGMILNDLTEPLSSGHHEPKNWETPVPLSGNGAGNGPGLGLVSRTNVDMDENVDDEAANPILSHRHGHQSYQNPYDIRYQSNDDISVYHVDPPQSQSQISLNQGLMVPNQDSYGYIPSQSTDTLPPARGQYLDPRSHYQSGLGAQFPEARSTGTDAPHLRREASNATTIHSRSASPGDKAEFPVPLPSHSGANHVDHGRDHPHSQNHAGYGYPTGR